jgi:hypothetical protein
MGDARLLHGRRPKGQDLDLDLARALERPGNSSLVWIFLKVVDSFLLGGMVRPRFRMKRNRPVLIAQWANAQTESSWPNVVTSR